MQPNEARLSLIFHVHEGHKIRVGDVMTISKGPEDSCCVHLEPNSEAVKNIGLDYVDRPSGSYDSDCARLADYRP